MFRQMGSRRRAVWRIREKTLVALLCWRAPTQDAIDDTAGAATPGHSVAGTGGINRS
jgi:hypothetical protein